MEKWIETKKEFDKADDGALIEKKVTTEYEGLRLKDKIDIAFRSITA